jgi:tape measure domain-containing protein
MVDRVIRVVVDASGARAGLRGVSQEAKTAQTNLSGLKTAAVGVIAALGVRELAEYADTWTLINNRLKLVTSSSDELAAVQNELLDLANETRTPLQATAELYSRVARSTGELGLSQQEVLDLTKSVNQAIQVSGATAAEAGAGVIQFAQGLASGALRGDELRSVLEQMPRLAQALSKGLGVGIGELRELGAEGELTADKVIGALQKTAPELQAEFEQLTPTIQGGFTVLENSVLEFVGKLDTALGTSQAFGRSMQDLGKYIQDVTGDVVQFGIAAQGTFAVFFAEIDAAITPLDEKFRLFQNTLVGTLATIIGDEETANAAAQARAGLERELTQTETDAFRRLQEIRKNLEAEFTKKSLDFAANENVDVDLTEKGQAAVKVSKDVKDAMEDAQKSADKLLTKFQDQALELEKTRTLGDAAAGTLRGIEIQELALAGASDTTVESLRAANAELSKQEELTRLEDLNTDREEYIESLQEEYELLQLNNEQREIQQALNELGAEATDEQRKQVEELVSNIQTLKKEQEATFAFTETIAEQTSYAIRGLIKDAFTGDFDDIQSKFADFLSKLGQELLTSLFMQLLADAFGGFGNPFGNALSQAFGGTGRQEGGPVSAGQPYIVGEGNRPEVFIPREAGTIAPMAGMAQAQPQIIVINEQDPEGMLAVNRTRAGTREFRNRVTADQRKINRTLGIR